MRLRDMTDPGTQTRHWSPMVTCLVNTTFRKFPSRWWEAVLYYCIEFDGNPFYFATKVLIFFPHDIFYGFLGTSEKKISSLSSTPWMINTSQALHQQKPMNFGKLHHSAVVAERLPQSLPSSSPFLCPCRHHLCPCACCCPCSTMQQSSKKMASSKQVGICKDVKESVVSLTHQTVKSELSWLIRINSSDLVGVPWL